MILISHRGNFQGSDPDQENKPSRILEVLSKGYHCEIDVWTTDEKWLLGHDEPQFEVEERFLENPNLWCHAKNIAAMERMLLNGKIHCFWHENDDCTLTSQNYIWTLPGKFVTTRSVVVNIGSDWVTKNYRCSGICSDYL